MLAMRPDPGNVSPTDHPRSKKKSSVQSFALGALHVHMIYCVFVLYMSMFLSMHIYLSIYLSIYIYRYTYMYTYIISIYVHYDPLVSPIITYDNRSKAHGVNEDGRSSEAID